VENIIMVSCVTKATCLVVLIAIVGLSNHAQSQPEWHHLHGGNINDVFFLDASRGWTAEEGGRSRYTMDGGFTWEYATMPDDLALNTPLRGLFFLDTSRGWAVGDGGVVLQWDEAFKEWTDANPFSRVTDKKTTGEIACGTQLASLEDIFMIDEDIGWVVGYDGAIATTTTGGATWVDATPPPPISCEVDPHDLYDIHFFSDGGSFLKGAISSDYGILYSTTDGGVNWNANNMQGLSLNKVCPSVVSSEDSIELWALGPADPADSTSAFWVVGGSGVNNGYIFTNDSLFGPLPADDVTNNFYQSRCYEFMTTATVCGLSTLYGFAVLDGTPPYRTVTAGYAGDAWVFEGGGTPNFDPCNDTSCPPLGLPTVCDPQGNIWVEKNTDVNVANPCNAQVLFNAAAKINTTEACMVGRFARISRYNSNGTVTETGTTYFTRIFGGEFINGSKGCAIGQAFVIMRTTDGGVTWADVSIPGTVCDGGQGNALDFSQLTGSYGVTVGTGGFIGYSTDQGATWSEATSAPRDLNAVSFVEVPGLPNTADVYAVGSAGLVVRSDDQGATWALKAEPSSGADLHGVAFASPLVGWVVGDNGSVYKTANGADSWQKVRVPASATGTSFYDVETWAGGSQAIIVGENGTVLKTDTLGHLLVESLGGLDLAGIDLRDVEVQLAGSSVQACGDLGVVIMRDSLGTWSQARSFTNNPLYKVAFQDADNGFSLGKNFNVLKYGF